ncbi:MAG: bifunctional 5,10-methylenetetrahydrofolate dehydrogenase/5,10-methenyltetrahydrofolate cyclohydrolase [Candidatus Methylacidiphilales bacterium]
MSAQLIDGKTISNQLYGETRQRVEALISRGVRPKIVFVRVGEDPASKAYVAMKDRRAEELGILTETKELPESTGESTLLSLIELLNVDPSVHGILVQAPLPSHLSETKVFSTVSPDKDVDGFHPMNVGKLLLGSDDGFRPCTPAGIQELLIRSGIETSGKNVLILGRGNIVGKPMAAILCQKSNHANATVTLAHSRTRQIESHCAAADIIIAAMGVPLFLKADMILPGATIIDVGVNRVEDPASPKGYRLVGDVDFEALKDVAGFITPNPGGVGPMTIAVLMGNTVRAAELLTR